MALPCSQKRHPKPKEPDARAYASDTILSGLGMRADAGWPDEPPVTPEEVEMVFAALGHRIEELFE